MFQGYVDASPSDAFKEIVVNIESSPSWNPTLIECRVCSSVLHFRSWFCKNEFRSYHLAVTRVAPAYIIWFNIAAVNKD